MKPIIIYSMPRTKSTAALQACIKPNKIFEPFNSFNLFNINFNNHINDKKLYNSLYVAKATEINNLYASFANSLSDNVTLSLFEQLNDPRTACKITCVELLSFLPARTWFKNADKNKTHDIFVLTRNLREQMFSYLLAGKFGYFKDTQCDPYEITILESDFVLLSRVLDNFLRFLPKNGFLVEFENLPSNYFNSNEIAMLPQNSMSKLSYIKNLDFCEYHIMEISKYYQSYWDEKISELNTI